jgi:hypothetical protein
LVCTEDPARCSAYPICAMCISEEHFNGWFVQQYNPGALYFAFFIFSSTHDNTIILKITVLEIDNAPLRKETLLTGHFSFLGCGSTENCT